MTLQTEKVELLRNAELFAHLREYELDIISEHSEFVSFKKGQSIFAQNSDSTAMFVVESGRVGIMGLDAEDDAVIAQIVEHESFGDLDFFGGTKRTASAFAETDTVLLKFPAAGYEKEEMYKKHSVIFAHLLYTLLGTLSERIWNVNRLLNDKTDWIFDLHKQLLCDKMTGLYNQIYLKEDFVSLLPETGTSVALLMIKPDNFKEINDRFGHVAGDQALNLMAIFLHSELSGSDIGVRYRGDEYAAILIDADRDKALQRAAEIIKTFEEMDLSGVTGGESVRIQVSVGIAIYPEEASGSAELVAAAHKKMFEARDSGGNRAVI